MITPDYTKKQATNKVKNIYRKTPVPGVDHNSNAWNV